MLVVACGGAWGQDFTEGGAPGIAKGEATTTEILVAPADVAIVQTDYGVDSAVEIVWANPEMYESVEFAVDGDDVACIPILGRACGDGADGLGLLAAPAGLHSFSVRGRLGGRASTWSTAEFLVLEASPVPEPIVNLDCEFVPVKGGMLLLRWDLGSDVWIRGRLGFTADGSMPRVGNFQSIAEGATAAEILVPLDEASVPVDAQAVLAWRNEEGYFSPRFTPPCEQRTPTFRRGDCNADGRVNITDTIFNLNHLFVEGPRGFCDDGCDANDDGVINLSDSIATLEFLFKGGPQIPSPGPLTCGMDTTEDFLGGVCFCPEPPAKGWDS